MNRPTSLPGQRLQQILELPDDWHAAGSLSAVTLMAIARHCAQIQIQHSLETGAGKSTLLFSYLSPDHKVFATDDGNGSITQVKASPLLNRASVEFIEGPTQRMLPQYEFCSPLHAVLLDGPHGYPFPELEYYYIYPHLEPGALLIIDDIHIPTIHHMFEFLRMDEMFRLLEVVEKTAFFVRTDTPTFNPFGDGWWLQQYNLQPLTQSPATPSASRLAALTKRFLPRPLKTLLKALRRGGDRA